MTISLYARLEGVAPFEKKFSHAGIEWTGESRGERVMRSTEESKNLDPEKTAPVQHSWSKTLELREAGIYRYQVTLHLKDGSTLQSNTVDVSVLSNY